MVVNKTHTGWHPELPPYRLFKKSTYAKLAKTSQFIYQLGESPLLSCLSKPVGDKDFTTAILKQKIIYLKRCLFRFRRITGYGRGISAVQIGIPERIGIIYMPELKDNTFIFINPVIEQASDKLLRFAEMCMSTGNLVSPVVRPSHVICTYYDEHGIKHTWNNSGTSQIDRLYNRVLQHEIDHMNGILCIEKTESSTLKLESDPQFYATTSFEEL